MRVYRLNPKAQRSRAFAGFGASLHPGRWNLRGTPVVYASATLSLAFLELFVHLPTIRLRTLSDHYESIAADLKDSSIYEVDLGSLPRDWQNLTTLPDSTQQLGTQWMAELKYAAVSVPSAVFPSERNYLINPRHPDFAVSCLVAPHQPIFVDPRILGKLV